MNHMQKGVIMLIKSAITGEAQPLPEGFSIDEAYGFIVKHKIMMLAYDGAVRCGIPKENPTMQKLFQSYIQGLLYSEKQMKAVSEIYSAFDKNGIDYLPLKGCNMKYLYPKPELRSMGDADILIREEQYKSIKDIVSALGFAESEETVHHYVWTSENLHLELHTKPMPENYRIFYNYYKDGWDKAKTTATHKYIYSNEDEFVFLLTHFAKHYLDGGIGCRHVADILVYLNVFSNMDMSYIEAEFDKLGILEFYKNIRKLLDIWFGNGESDEKAELISNFILRSGNWGDVETHAIADGARNNRINEKASKLKFLIRAAFPSLELIGPKYGWVKKLPFLLPVAWLQRAFYLVFFKGERIRVKMKSLELVDNEKIDIHRKNLEDVGFRF